MSERTEATGRWLLLLESLGVNGYTETIEIRGDAFGGTEPQWYEHENTLTFVWMDGRRQVWSWNAIVRADYTPPGAEAAS